MNLNFRALLIMLERFGIKNLSVSFLIKHFSFCILLTDFDLYWLIMDNSMELLISIIGRQLDAYGLYEQTALP